MTFLPYFLTGNQNLKYTLRTSDTFRVMHTGRLPINKGDTLRWIGITDEGVRRKENDPQNYILTPTTRFP